MVFFGQKWAKNDQKRLKIAVFDLKYRFLAQKYVSKLNFTGEKRFLGPTKHVESKSNLKN